MPSPARSNLHKILSLLVFCAASALVGAPMAARSAPHQPGAGEPTPVFTAAGVAAPDRYGAEAAQEILLAGGNAVDAAIAEAFALAVTYPEAGNLGGGGFMTLYVEGKPYFLDYRETAPAAATPTLYLDGQGNPVRAQSTIGNLSVAVPGTVRGMAEAHRRFGKLSWARDLAPASRLAQQGFAVSQHLIGVRDIFTPRFKGVTNYEAHFGTLSAGKLFRQPLLAQTLRRIAKDGDKEFYQGRTAKLIVAQMARGQTKGVITEADLAAYKAQWRIPVMGEWRGYTVITAAPPSSGGIALLQLLGMKEKAAPLFKGVALNSPQYLHLLSEIEKRVFADRARYLGDPDFIPVPIASLIDPAYLALRAAEIDPTQPSPTGSVQPGLEKPQTTHFSIVDKWGNAVSNTYTLNGWFGSGVVVEHAGFLLNDEMDDFSAKPGAPNQLGLVGDSANAIAPRKRPLSSMSPTIITRDGRVAMVLGTPGGSRIPTSLFQLLADVYDFDLPLAQALGQPRYHHQLLPANTIYSEPYAPFAPALSEALSARGYITATQNFNGDIAAVQVIGNTPVPASDPRGRGVSVSVR